MSIVIRSPCNTYFSGDYDSLWVTDIRDAAVFDSVGEAADAYMIAWDEGLNSFGRSRIASTKWAKRTSSGLLANKDFLRVEEETRVVVQEVL